MPEYTPTRTCYKCGQTKPLTAEFWHHHKNKGSGFEYLCKSCVLVYHKTYDAAHREAKAQYDRVRHQRIADSERERKRKHRREHPTMYHLARCRREAQELKLPSTFGKQDWQRALDYWNHRCAICGRPNGLWHKLAPDHWIPLTSSDCPGSIPENIVPLCHGQDGCNNHKYNFDPETWLVREYGRRKATKILKAVKEYFDWIKRPPALSDGKQASAHYGLVGGPTTTSSEHLDSEDRGKVRPQTDDETTK